MTKAEDRIAALEKEIAALKSAQPPKYPDAAEVARHRAEMHAMSERRMANAYIPSRAERDAFNAATPPDVCRGLAQDGRAPLTPRGMLPSDPKVSNVRPANVPGGGTGWSNETPIRPPPGVAQADRLMDAQDRRDRYEAEQREAAIKRAERQKR